MKREVDKSGLSAGMLAAGTNMGNVALWKFTPSLSGKKKEGEDLWSLQAPATVEGPVRKVEVSKHQGKSGGWMCFRVWDCGTPVSGPPKK